MLSLLFTAFTAAIVMESNFLSQQGFELLDPAEIQANMDLITLNPTINTAVMFRINDILSGRVMYTYKNSPEEIPGSESLAQHSHKVLVQTLLQRFALGFSACVTEGDVQEDNDERWAEYAPSAKRTGRGKEIEQRMAESRNIGPQDGWETGEGPNKPRKLNARDFRKAKTEDLNIHVLDLTKVDVYWRKDVYGRQTLRFFVRPSSMGLTRHVKAFDGDDELHQREIHHVFFIIDDDPVVNDQKQHGNRWYLQNILRLDRVGFSRVRLTSAVSRLIDVMQLSQHNVACHKLSSLQMANPAILLQDQPHALDPNDSGAMGLNVGIHGTGPISDDFTSSTAVQTVYAPRASNEREQAYYENTYQRRKEESCSTSEAVSSTVEVTVSETTIAEMSPGKTVARQLPSQAVPYLLELIHLEKERVWEVLGVPQSVQLENCPRKKSAMTVGESAGGVHENRESIAGKVYEASQRGLRRRLLSYMQGIIDYMTHYHTTMSAKLSWEEEEDEDEEDGPPKRKRQKKETANGIKIVLPGLPNPEVIVSLFKLGMLKYEYTHQTVGQYYDVDVNAWYAQPKLTLQEMSGIQEPNDDPSEAGKLLSGLAQKSREKGSKKKKSK